MREEWGGEGNSLAGRLRALSSLACTLGWLFSYLSREAALEAVSTECAERCRALFAEAVHGLRPVPPIPGEEVAAAALVDEAAGQTARPLGEDDEGERAAAALRRECTRLFYAPFQPVPLLGSKWVEQRNLLSRKTGERSAVEQECLRMGVVRKPASTNPSDHLSCELDFISFLAAAEADVLDAGDAASARELKKLRERFVDDHAGELAAAVSREVLARSSNVHLRFFAQLLQAFAGGCDF